MKVLKKLLFVALATVTLFGISTLFNPKVNASKYYSYKATTKVPLRYVQLEQKNNKLIFPTKKFIEENAKYHFDILKKIDAGTKIEIYSKPTLQLGENKYYQVVFKSKKYADLIKGAKGPYYPTIEIKNFNQLKNMHKVNDN